MEQSIFTWHDFHETAIRHDGTYCSFVNFTNFRYSHDSLDLSKSSIDNFLVSTANLNLTLAICLIDCDCSTCLFLHLLDDLSTRTDDSTDKFFRNLQSYYTRNLRFKFCTWFSDSISQFTKDMFTTSLRLHKSLFKNIETESVTLDIHLRSCKTVFRTCGLEVHISQVVFITQNISINSILVFARLLDKSHCDTAYRFLHRNTGIHQSQCTSTYRSHRRRTVALKDFTHQTYCIRIIFRYLILQCAPCQMTMTNLTTAYTALSLSLACTERREVVVQHETLVTLL